MADDQDGTGTKRRAPPPPRGPPPPSAGGGLKNVPAPKGPPPSIRAASEPGSSRRSSYTPRAPPTAAGPALSEDAADGLSAVQKWRMKRMDSSSSSRGHDDDDGGTRGPSSPTQALDKSDRRSSAPAGTPIRVGQAARARSHLQHEDDDYDDDRNRRPSYRTRDDRDRDLHDDRRRYNDYKDDDYDRGVQRRNVRDHDEEDRWRSPREDEPIDRRRSAGGWRRGDEFEERDRRSPYSHRDDEHDGGDSGRREAARRATAHPRLQHEGSRPGSRDSARDELNGYRTPNRSPASRHSRHSDDASCERSTDLHGEPEERSRSRGSARRASEKSPREDDRDRRDADLRRGRLADYGERELRNSGASSEDFQYGKDMEARRALQQRDDREDTRRNSSGDEDELMERPADASPGAKDEESLENSGGDGAKAQKKKKKKKKPTSPPAEDKAGPNAAVAARRLAGLQPVVYDTERIPIVVKELLAFVQNPFERQEGVVLRCFIERCRSLLNRLSPVYNLYSDNENGSGRLIMSARKVAASTTPYYIFSTNPDDLGKSRSDRSKQYLGKLRGNTTGTEYVLYDRGQSPDDVFDDDSSDEEARNNDYDEERVSRKLRRELLVVTYNYNLSGDNARKMEVAIPKVTPLDDGTGSLSLEIWQPRVEKDSMAASFRKCRFQGAQNVFDSERMFVMHQKESKYDPLSSCLVDFRGRATAASIKNFQVIKSFPEDAEQRKLYYSSTGEGKGETYEPDAIAPVVLQMGRVGQDCFNMDVQHPLSVLQAFAVCVSRFDTKSKWT